MMGDSLRMRELASTLFTFILAFVAIKITQPRGVIFKELKAVLQIVAIILFQIL
jgi:hypothetical protein